MEFSRRKLPAEAADNLRACPIAEVKPYTLTLAPAYVFMKANEKFVGVKGPLDFFTPADLARFKTFGGEIHFSEFIDSIKPFQRVARELKALFNWAPEIRMTENLKAAKLAPASFEMSDAALRKLAPLWTSDVSIEPFFTVAFTETLCGSLSAELLERGRDGDVLRYESALFLSSWAVFLAVHFGYTDCEYLVRLRMRVFEESLSALPAAGRSFSEVDELIELARTSIAEHELKSVTAQFFLGQSTRASRKLAARLDRVKTRILPEVETDDDPKYTIHGGKGFIDV